MENLTVDGWSDLVIHLIKERNNMEFGQKML